MKRLLLFLGSLTIIVLAMIYAATRPHNNPQAEALVENNSDLVNKTAIIRTGSVEWNVEVARTTEEQSRGLANRQGLEPGTGMLFPFQPPQKPAFWMKDMRFSLDIIWIRENKIISIDRDVPTAPGVPTRDLPTYLPPGIIDHVLEVTAGQAETLKVGDELTILYVSST